MFSLKKLIQIFSNRLSESIWENSVNVIRTVCMVRGDSEGYGGGGIDVPFGGVLIFDLLFRPTFLGHIRPSVPDS